MTPLPTNRQSRWAAGTIPTHGRPLAVVDVRIAIIYDCLFPGSTGGGERVYRRVADSLVARGHAVDYLTREGQSDGSESFSVHGLWAGDLYDDHGVRRPRAAIGFALAVARFLVRRRDDYDLVVCSALPVLTLFAAKAVLVGRRAHLLADWLEVWPWSKWRRYAGAGTGTIAWMLQRIGVRLADTNVVNSRFTAGRLVGQGGAEPIVWGLIDLVPRTSYSGPSAFDRTALGVSSPSTPPRAQDPVFLAVGRLIADKHVDSIPAALAIVRRRFPRARLVVVGHGPEESAVRLAADDAGISDQVEFLGRVDDAELACLLAASTVHVSASEREGFGLVVAEAAAAGVPSVVVAGPDNAAIELIEEGVNGWIAASRSPDDLAAAMLAAAAPGARATTAAWFGKERIGSSIETSLDLILARVLHEA